MDAYDGDSNNGGGYGDSHNGGGYGDGKTAALRDRQHRRFTAGGTAPHRAEDRFGRRSRPETSSRSLCTPLVKAATRPSPCDSQGSRAPKPSHRSSTPTNSIRGSAMHGYQDLHGGGWEGSQCPLGLHVRLGARTTRSGFVGAPVVKEQADMGRSDGGTRSRRPAFDWCWVRTANATFIWRCSTRAFGLPSALSLAKIEARGRGRGCGARRRLIEVSKYFGCAMCGFAKYHKFTSVMFSSD